MQKVSFQPVRYQACEDGTFVVANYQYAKPLSSFLPGISGLYGKPAWAYYVNRGQAIASFGVQDRNNAFLEFESFHRHCSRVAVEGFRTFLRLRRGTQVIDYEPFQIQTTPAAQTELRVTPFDLAISERNESLGLSVEVAYGTVPNQPFAGLVRRVTIRNLSSAPVEVELLDGLPKVVPYGMETYAQKYNPFVVEGFLEVANIPDRTPVIRFCAKPSDNPENEYLFGGNFFFGLLGEGPGAELLPAITDPGLIFGDNFDYRRPHAFDAAAPFDPLAPQIGHCLTPCAFVHHKGVLPGQGAWTILEIFGRVRSDEQARAIPDVARAEGFWPQVRRQNQLEVERVRSRSFIHCGQERLNVFVPHTFLENVLRGGLPIRLPAGGREEIFHVYSRRHGDLERDYNMFLLEPTCYSQGDGHYRDVNQNRRTDVWFEPAAGIENLRWFFNLIQVDGFNPFEVKGTRFVVRAEQAGLEWLAQAFDGGDISALQAVLAKPFSPGQVLEAAREGGAALRGSPEDLLSLVLARCDKLEDAAHGQGYWIDHWYYNFDLLESYLAIFPDTLREVLIEQKTFSYWDDPIRVAPRDEKHVLYRADRVRQVDSVVRDGQKEHRLARRRTAPHRVRIGGEEGEVHFTNLLEKILCLLVNKASSISPSGVGMEMESGLPGWNDAMNGLPALFGAGTSEVYQLERAARMTRDLCSRAGVDAAFSQQIPAELLEFIRKVQSAFESYLGSSDATRDFACWDAATTAREEYRCRAHAGFASLADVSGREILMFLDTVIQRAALANARASGGESGIPLSYMIHWAAQYETLRAVDPVTGEMGVKRNRRGMACVRVKKFDAQPMPLFLEGPAHALRLADAAQAKRIWTQVRQSPLYDRKLKMYLLCESLRQCPEEIGRLRAWPGGWYENENVFMHCEHKYLLGLLLAGLYDEFFEDFRNCLVPFQDLERLARNPFENLSVIISSRYPDPDYHGRGMLPRSTGTTCEILHMMLVMSFGQQPFTVREGELTLEFKPVLPEWMFTRTEQVREIVSPEGRPGQVHLPADSYSALFLSRTMVTYVNPGRKATFGDNAARAASCEITFCDGTVQSVQGACLSGLLAHAVRDGKVKTIRVLLD